MELDDAVYFGVADDAWPCAWCGGLRNVPEYGPATDGGTDGEDG